MGTSLKDAVSLAVKSPKFITLSALYDACTQLLGKLPEDVDDETEAEKAELAARYWNAVTESVPEWKQVRDGDLKPSEARSEYVHSHAVTFWALGAAGKTLMAAHPEDWEDRMGRLTSIDWKKVNPEWQGIAMLGNDIITRRQTKDAMTKYIEWELGLVAQKPEPVLETAA